MAGKEIVVAGKGDIEPKVIEAFNPMSLMPQKFGDKYTMAKVLSASGLLPSGLNTPEKVCVALEWGHELQLSPMVAVNSIAVINGKPTLSAEIMAAIVKRSPEFGGIEWKELTDKAAECVVTRRSANYEEKTSSRFTFDDAVKAGLTNKDVWKKYPKRMLKHRCLSYALRDAFPDLLAGIYNPEEMESDGGGNYQQAEREAPPEKNITEEATATVEPAAQNPQTADVAVSLEAVLNENKPLFNQNDYSNAVDCLKNGNPQQIQEMYNWAVGFVEWAKTIQ